MGEGELNLEVKPPTGEIRIFFDQETGRCIVRGGFLGATESHIVYAVSTVLAWAHKTLCVVLKIPPATGSVQTMRNPDERS